MPNIEGMTFRNASIGGPESPFRVIRVGDAASSTSRDVRCAPRAEAKLQSPLITGDGPTANDYRYRR